MRIVLPPSVAQRASAVATGAQEAVSIGPAATVVLVRPAEASIEVYLQRRHTGLAFAGGMFAFPGGRVDPADATVPDSAWCGPGPQAWAQRFAADPPTARSHVVAVVRELFEETGVLLAVPADGSGAPRAASASPWPDETDRQAVSDGRPLAELLAEYELAIDSGSLVAWSRWVTPRFERRRFDAWFFVAALPAGQQPRVATGESHSERWVRPADGLDEMKCGQLAMLPPTWWTLSELTGVHDVADVHRAAPPMVRHTVGWAREGDDAVMVLPGDPRYPGDDPKEGT